MDEKETPSRLHLADAEKEDDALSSSTTLGDVLRALAQPWILWLVLLFVLVVGGVAIAYRSGNRNGTAEGAIMLSADAEPTPDIRYRSDYVDCVQYNVLLQLATQGRARTRSFAECRQMFDKWIADDMVGQFATPAPSP